MFQTELARAVYDTIGFVSERDLKKEHPELNKFYGTGRLSVMDDYLAHVIKKVPDIPIQEYLKIRKLHAQGKFTELKKILRVSTNSDILGTLEVLDCIAFSPKRAEIREFTSLQRNIVDVLVNYYLTSSNLIISLGKSTVSFAEYVERVRYVTKKKDAKNLLTGQGYEVITKTLTPKMKFVKGTEITVIGGEIYLPSMISAEELETLVAEAIRFCYFRSVDVADYVIVVASALTYSIDDKAYLTLMDIANYYDVTIDKLFEMCGMNMPKRLEIFNNHGVIITMISDNKYRIVSPNSKRNGQFLEVNLSTLYGLLSSGNMSQLEWGMLGEPRIGDRIIDRRMSVFSGAKGQEI